MFASATRQPAHGGLRRALTRAGAVVATLVLAACEPGLGTEQASGPETGQLIDPSQPVRVALLAPAGTGSADLEWLARSLKNSAKMAAGDAQGATIDLRIYDTGASTEAAVTQANAAVDAGAQIILGPLFAEGANAVGNAMAPRNVNVLTFSNNTQVAGGNVFILGNSFENIADRLVGYGVKQGKRNVLVVAEDDVAGQLGGAAIQTAIARNGARMAGRINHPVSVTGIDAVVPRVAEAAKSGNVDSVFLTANHQAVLPYLTQQLADAGVRSPVTQMMGLTRWDQPASRLSEGQLAEGWFAIPDQGLQRQFEARYSQAYGEQPHPLASLSYDGVAAIASLARSGRRNALTSTALTQRSGFAGVGGIFRLKGDRTIQRGLSVATIRNGQLVILDPAPQSARGFGS
ncbi:penicillin-binding protein activator [Paracoccus sp. 1_MG-2023]|uniref:penicillin-binding protein activator n=1 Tax=unclassified Paracoccus (in: a-proteobacteria) TaxID=2688777 RepID=UPI001C0A0D96|nr:MULTISPECIES: penicillin-binding protein activator [unclassified Paracoccus (in: a-proteobacteria)]MBU2956770.1 penicillin-binding protein activator [Paracoccus sp. C2R09]MDO6669191.1 penicillin-binding protein activator [Paracoccus sp. 1_MG-2023]